MPCATKKEEKRREERNLEQKEIHAMMNFDLCKSRKREQKDGERHNKHNLTLQKLHEGKKRHPYKKRQPHI
jgi:hypothetical protein